MTDATRAALLASNGLRAAAVLFVLGLTGFVWEQIDRFKARGGVLNPLRWFHRASPCDDKVTARAERAERLLREQLPTLEPPVAIARRRPVATTRKRRAR